ncbi:MAG: AbrB/MazE/SpoVT family DNA-binding domain-containing protein [Candidatus Woesearchaeota archaeon]
MMSEVEITSASVKGQVVIPQKIREELGIVSGTKFAVYGKNDTVVLKKLRTPSAEEFEKLVNFGVKFAKEKGIKNEKDVERLTK